MDNCNQWITTHGINISILIYTFSSEQRMVLFIHNKIWGDLNNIEFIHL